MYGNSNLEVSSIQQSEAEILRMTPMEPTMPQRPQEVNSLPVMDHGAIELPSVGLSSSQGEEPRNPSGFGGHSKGQEERFNPC